MLTVGSIMRETPAMTLRFVVWYLAQGADRVRILFDDPLDPAIDLLAGDPRVDCIPCTPAFWESIGLTAEARFTLRQNHGMTWLFGQTAEGWFLNVDADEYVWLEGRMLSEELDALDPGVTGVSIVTAERVHTPGIRGTHFRLHTYGAGRARLYGPVGNPLLRRSGMIGHHIGKSVTRAGIAGASLRQHWSHGPDGTRLQNHAIGHRERAYLLHFHDAGYEGWRAKLDWRLASSGFRAIAIEKLRELRARPDAEAAIRALYDHATLFDIDRLGTLAEVGSHLGLTLDFDALVGMYFPAVAPDGRRAAA